MKKFLRSTVAMITCVAMLMGITGCSSEPENNKGEERTSLQKENEELEDSTVEEPKETVEFKEVDGKIQVYLPVQYTSTWDYEDSKGTHTVEYLYDDRGLLETIRDVEREEASDGDYFTSEENYYKYNDDYQLIEMIEDNKSTTYEYYQNGDLYRVVQDGYAYTFENNIMIDGYSRYWNYSTNEDGYITDISCNHYNGGDTTFQSENKYYYDDQNRLEKMVCTDYNYNEKTYEVLYSDQGLITSYGEGKMSYNEDGKIESREGKNYFYGDNGLISHIIDTNRDEDKSRYLVRFEYDEYGNLIKMYTDDNKQEEKIEYKEFYIDKEYWDKYLGYWYYKYQCMFEDRGLGYETYVVEINKDIYQNFFLWEQCGYKTFENFDIRSNPFLINDISN